MADKESPQADKENIAEEMRYAEQLEREAEYQAQSNIYMVAMLSNNFNSITIYPWN